MGAYDEFFMVGDQYNIVIVIPVPGSQQIDRRGSVTIWSREDTGDTMRLGVTWTDSEPFGQPFELVLTGEARAHFQIMDYHGRLEGRTGRIDLNSAALERAALISDQVAFDRRESLQGLVARRARARVAEGKAQKEIRLLAVKLAEEGADTKSAIARMAGVSRVTLDSWIDVANGV